jgi:hypothetical protein
LRSVLPVQEDLREKPQAHQAGRIGMLWDGGAVHAVPVDRVQALWPLVLRTSATASIPAVITTHSNSMAGCQPRRA